MKVRVLRSFASREHGSFQQGTVAHMPEGAGWVEAGHAEPAEDQTNTSVGEDLFQTEEAEGQADQPDQSGTVTDEVDVSEHHTGGGWYDVPGSEKKVRKNEAEELLREAANG